MINTLSQTMNLKYSSILVVLLFAASMSGIQAQQIEATVYSITNAPISEVSVFAGSKKLAETDIDGFFILSESFNLPLKVRLEHPDFFLSEVEIVENHSVFRLSPLSKSEELDEVILSASPFSDVSTSQIIIPTEKITSAKIDTYSPVDLISAVNETPGVFIQSGAINTNRITIRGVGSRTLYGTNKIRAYFNGIPITDGSGETIIDMFDPENLQSLEIIKGPKSTQYGSNLGGTLLLTSKQAEIGKSFASNSLTLGSYGLLKNTVSAGTSSEKFSFNLNYDHLETDGFRENNRYDRHALLATSSYRFNSKNEISLLMNYIDYFAQIPSSIGKTAFEENPSQAAFTWKEAQGYEDNKRVLTGLSFTHRFSENFSNITSIFYSYLDHYEPRPFNILDEFTNGYGARTVFSKDFLFLKKTANLSFGGEIYKDQYNWKTIENLYEDNNGQGSLEGNLLSDNIEKRNNLNIFASVIIPFSEKFEGQFGLNFNKANYNFLDDFNEGGANKSTKRDFDPIIAPNVNLLYRFNSEKSVFLNVSRGFNYPSIEETLTPEGVINPNLGPEKGFNYEVGSDLFFLKGKLHFRVNAYLLDIDDLVVAERVGDDEYIGRNAGKTEHKGIEMSILYTHSFNTTTIVSPYVNAEISDHKFIDFVDGENDFSGNQLTGVPNTKINGGINFIFRNFHLNTNLLHIGKMPLNDSNEDYLEKYSVFNAKLSYKTQLSEALSIEVNAGINNFTDEKYAASVLINATGFGNAEPRFYYPGMPRNWFSGLKVRVQL